MTHRPRSVCGAFAAGVIAALLCADAPAPAFAATPPPDAPTRLEMTPPGTAAALPPSAAAPSEDIRDIRGPKWITPAWLLPALVAAAVLLALGAYGAWRWWRRRRRPRVLLPFELALQRLEQIRALLQPARVREFSIAVSDIVRSYIEQRFEVTATHRTTEEFLRDLLDSSNVTLARHRGLLSAFLQQCDLVKFAGMSLNLQSMESLHDSARAFVLETAKHDPLPAT
jgi:hypothetical protein